MHHSIVRRRRRGGIALHGLSLAFAVAFVGAGCKDTPGSPTDTAAAGDSAEGGAEHSSAGASGGAYFTAGKGGQAAQTGGADATTSQAGAAGGGISEAEAGATWVGDEGAVGFGEAPSVACAADDKALGPALYPVEQGPTATLFADLNDDGRDDWMMLVAGNVSVRLGVVGGGWQSPTLYPVGATPRQLLITDVDADGVRDLVVGNGYDASISLLVGSADGSFAAARTFPVPAIIDDIITAKLNADKYPDLALTTVRGEVITLLNTGFDRFEHSYDYTLPSVLGLAALDIDANGTVDLMVGASTADGEAPAVQAFLNDGKGAFALGPSFWPGTQPLLLSADLNDDDRLDLVVADLAAPHVSLLFAKPSGGFERPQRYRVAIPPRALATVDADRDGELDLAMVLGGSPSGVVVLRNQGGGRFGAATSYAIGGLPSLLSVGDVNADGAPDLVLTHHELDAVTHLLNRGNGSFAGPVTHPSDEDPFDGIALDLDQDGRPDLARLGMSGALGISLNLGGERFGMSQTYSVGSAANAVASVEADRDLHLDVAVGSADGILVFRGQEGGSLASPLAYAPSVYTYSLAAGDLDGDGYDDLAFVGGDVTTTLGAIFGQEDGGFGAPVIYPQENAATPYMVAAGDFNGDDELDLASISLDGSKLGVRENLGDRSFAPPVEYVTGEAPLQLVSVDLDRDEHLDIAVVSRSQLNIFINRSDGTFDATQYPAGPNAADLVAGDFDGSGNVSFLVKSLENETVTLHLNDGSGKFTASRRFGGARGMIAADFDGDSATDVAYCVADGVAVMTSVCPGVADAP